MNVQVQSNSRTYYKPGLWSAKFDVSSLDDDDDEDIDSNKSTRHSSPQAQPSSSSPFRDDRPHRSDIVYSSDSIGDEMTHFKPIRMAPISKKEPFDQLLLRVPGLRHNLESNVIINRPAKSKFKPEAPLTVRNSAFCLFTSSGRQSTSTPSPAARSASDDDLTPLVVPPSFLPGHRNKSKRKRKVVAAAPERLTTEERHRRRQERNDYRLAQMLQDYDAVAPPEEPQPAIERLSGRRAKARTSGGGADAENESTILDSTLNTRRYFLRNRSKPSASGSGAVAVTNPPNGLHGPLKSSSRLRKMKH